MYAVSLKKDFDKYRELQKPHPFMERHGLGHLVPYKHDDFETWTRALILGLRTMHEPSGLIIGGGLDDVIDPADTRSWIAQGLKRLPPVPHREGKKHAYIDTW